MFTAQFAEGIITLANNESQATIWPAYGALLNEWVHQFPDFTFNAIEGYSSVHEAIESGERLGFRSMKLSPFVCRMRDGQYQWQGRRYKVNKYYLGDAAIHGLIYDVPYEVVACEANDKEAKAMMQYYYTGTDKGFPFSYKIEIVYCLGASSTLTITTSLTNLSTDSMPCSDGWHPYFTLMDEIDRLYLQMDTDAVLEFDEGLLPTGKRNEDSSYLQPKSLMNTILDNCFVVNAPGTGVACRLINKDKKVALEISPDANYPFLQVYTPPHRKSIAIENLSSAPDAFNNGMGLLTLAPGLTQSFTTSYCVKRMQ